MVVKPINKKRESLQIIDVNKCLESRGMSPFSPRYGAISSYGRPRLPAEMRTRGTASMLAIEVTPNVWLGDGTYIPHHERIILSRVGVTKTRVWIDESVY
jgi:hypothetical protein